MREDDPGPAVPAQPPGRSRDLVVTVGCLIAVVGAMAGLKLLAHQVPDLVRYLVVGVGLGGWVGYQMGRQAPERWLYAGVAAVVAIGFVYIDRPGPPAPTAEERLRQLEEKARDIRQRSEAQ